MVPADLFCLLQVATTTIVPDQWNVGQVQTRTQDVVALSQESDPITVTEEADPLLENDRVMEAAVEPEDCRRSDQGL